MKDILKKETDLKKSMFKDFLLSRNPSEKFVRTYFVYLNSSIVKAECLAVSKTAAVFAVQDRDALEKIYSSVKTKDKNIANHNVYWECYSIEFSYIYKHLIINKKALCLIAEGCTSGVDIIN